MVKHEFLTVMPACMGVTQIRDKESSNDSHLEENDEYQKRRVPNFFLPQRFVQGVFGEEHVKRRNEPGKKACENTKSLNEKGAYRYYR